MDVKNITLEQAEQIVAKEPLRFGDERQIEAIHVIEIANDYKERFMPSQSTQVEMRDMTGDQLERHTTRMAELENLLGRIDRSRSQEMERSI